MISRRWPVILVSALFVAFHGVSLAGGKADAAWIQLFNGKDLAGWDTWLGVPHRSVQGLSLTKNAKGDYTEPIGLNRDPKNGYSVLTVDGEPAIRISGEIFGALTTKEEFENYHFRLEFKWGEKKWAPREQAKRDSGVLYHCVGDHGAVGSFWMCSQEIQIQEGDCGDYFTLAGSTVDTEGVKGKDKVIHYQRGGGKFTVPSEGTPGRIIKSETNEKPHGQWNVMEVYLLGGTCYHVVNGKLVMILTNSRRKVGDQEIPLTKGKIQIQSEGAEVFYRRIALKPITALPEFP